jgi:DNA polymerase theta
MLVVAHRWQVDEYGGAYIATELGKATAAAGLDPKQALDVKHDLEKARQGFCMATDLHLTFLVTPVQEELMVNWQL